MYWYYTFIFLLWSVSYTLNFVLTYQSLFAGKAAECGVSKWLIPLSMVYTFFSFYFLFLFFYLPYLSSIHEKVMYHYVLEGKSAPTWELLF